MRVIDLALKDLLQIVRDWKAAFFLVLMPLVFTLVFGLAFGGSQTDSGELEDTRLPIGFIDQDLSQMSHTLLALLEGSDSVRPVVLEDVYPDEELNQLVQQDDWNAIILVPDGYQAALLADEQMPLITILKPETSAGAISQNAIQETINRLIHSLEAAKFSTDMAEQQAPFADTSARQAYFDQALGLAAQAWVKPPLSVEITQLKTEDPGVFEGSTNAYTHSSPGMMVQFALAGLIGAAEVLVLERTSGALKRLKTTAISTTEILLGHFIAMCIMIFVQFIVLIGFAQLFLQVPYLSAPLATLLVTLATTIFTASLGLLIGTLAKNPDQAIIFSLIPMFIFSGLGGAWMPLEFTSPTFQTLGHLTPLAWAMDGYQNIIIRGLGIESAWGPSGVLLGFGAICFGIAVWKFKFEWQKARVFQGQSG